MNCFQTNKIQITGPQIITISCLFTFFANKVNENNILAETNSSNSLMKFYNFFIWAIIGYVDEIVQ